MNYVASVQVYWEKVKENVCVEEWEEAAQEDANCNE